MTTKLSSIKKLCTYLWKHWKAHRTQSILNAIIGITLVISDLAFVWITKIIVDIATGVEHDTTMFTAIALLISIVVIQILLSLTSKWVRAILGVNATNKMKRELFYSILASEWSALKAIHTGNLVNRIEKDVTEIVYFLTESIPSLLTTLVQFVGAFILLYVMDSKLALLVAISLPLFALCSKLYIRKMRTISHQVRETESRVQSIIQESLQHSLIVKTLERIELIISRLNVHQDTLHKDILRKTKYSTISSTLMNLGFAGAYLTTFIWGAINLQNGVITYGALLAFIQLVGQIQGPVRTLTRFVPILISAATASERLMEIEYMPSEPNNEPTFPPEINDINIHLHQVCYHYTPNGKEVLNNLNHVIPHASFTAIIGETGAGKTTLIRLLLALTKPTNGSLFLTDKKGNRINICSATRKYFSYVPQGNTLLSGSIRENLQLGNPQASDEEIWEALKIAEAHFVERLPLQLDTQCTEMGGGLSEGQAQRISIARALLRNVPILLLDEATSALDEETEKRVLENISKYHKQQTIILITHRTENLKFCTNTISLG